MSVIGVPGIVSYSSSGALAPYDDTSVLAGASALAMSLAAPGQFSRDRVIVNTGTATHTISLAIDGTATSLTVLPGASVVLRPSPTAGTWLQIGASGTSSGSSSGSSSGAGTPTPGTNVVTTAGSNYYLPVYVAGAAGAIGFITVPNFVDSTSMLGSSLPAATLSDLSSAELVGYVSGTAKQIAPSVLAQYLASQVAPGAPFSPTLTSATGISVSGTFAAPVSGGPVQNVQVLLATSSNGTYKAANTAWSLSGSTYSFIAAGFSDGTALAISTTYWCQVVLGNVGGASAAVNSANSVTTTAQAQGLTLTAPSGTILSGSAFAVSAAFSPTYGSAPALTLKVDGTATTQPSGGSVSTTAATVEVPALTAGTHAVQVVDGSGNVSNVLSLTVTQNPFPMVFTGTAGATPSGLQAFSGSSTDGIAPGGIVYDGSGNVTVPNNAGGVLSAAGTVADGKTITVAMPSASATRNMGVLFRMQSSGTGYVVFFANGSAALYKFTSSGSSFISQISTAASTASVGVMANGSTFTFYVDGNSVGSISDSSMATPGAIGLLSTNGGSASVHQITVQ